MKFFLKVVVLLFLATVAFGDDSSEEDSSHELIKQIRSSHLKKIIKESNVTDTVEQHFDSLCPNSLPAIKTGLQHLANCTHGLTRNETVCNAVENSVKPCVKPLLTALEECIPENSKGLPTLIVDAIVSLFTHVCDLKASELLELWNHCVYDDEELSVEGKKCEALFKEKSEAYRQDVPSVKQICDFASQAKSCFNGHVESSCEHPVTRRVFRGAYDALIEPCNKFNQLTK